MKRKQFSRMRNIGVMAHIDAGKTTVTENILFLTGRSHVVGSVDQGTTTTDYTQAERKRGITIQSAAVNCKWEYEGEAFEINLIDTPGHIDFNGEVERSLRVLDGALALFCGVAGVETQSRTVWAQASKFGLSRIVFVNKMDRPGADFGKVVAQIREVFGANAVPLQLPWFEAGRFCGVIDLVDETAWYWREGAMHPEQRPLPASMLEEIAAANAQLLERLAEADDVFLEAYLDGECYLDVLLLRSAIRRATLSGGLVPVLLGSAFRHIGISQLLDAVAQYLPSPEEARFHDPSESFSGLIFKTISDRFAGRVGCLRVRSGSVRIGDQVFCPRTGTLERITRMFKLQGAQREDVDQAQAGDIVAIAGFKEMRSGDTLCDAHAVVELETIDFPAAVIDLAIELADKGDDGKLSFALNQLVAEDPTFHFRTDQDSGQLIVSGLGELHLEVVIDRLQDEYGLVLRTGKPSVAYRSTVTRTVRHHERLKKQNGGKGQYADIVIEVGPCEGATGLSFENAIVGGAISQQFIPAIEKGLRNAMARGLSNGYPLDGIHVRLLDGGIHREDSDANAFEICAAMALAAACKDAGPVVLEPVMLVEVRCPASYTGSVISDLHRRRGRILGMNPSVDGQVLDAAVPLSEMFGYVAVLRSHTAGTGSFAMRLGHYAAVPETLASTR